MLARTSVRTLGAMAVVALLAIAVGLWSQSPAKADCPAGTPNCMEVQTQAVVGGGAGANMVIECKWELPDASASDMTMTYGANDDTPSVLADGPACDGVTPPGNNRHHMIGILPNEDNDPIQRQYEKWVAVHSDNPGDIIDVFWKVWEPYVPNPPNGPNCLSGPINIDGVNYCFKYQHHATATLGPPTAANPLIGFSKNAGNCAALQAMTGMFAEAKATGQMAQGEVDKMILECGQGQKAIYRVQEQISKDQPYGQYRVEVTVVNSAGTPFTNVNWFDVLPFIYLNKDFTSVNWGTVVNNSTTTHSGDFDMSTPDLPTIENTGNQEMYVWTHFTPAILQSDNSKSITRFDSAFLASWQTDPLTIQSIDPQYASTWFCFNNQPLGADDQGKLDLSIHPENAQQGTYNGTVNVFANGGSCGTHP